MPTNRALPGQTGKNLESARTVRSFPHPPSGVKTTRKEKEKRQDLWAKDRFLPVLGFYLGTYFYQAPTLRTLSCCRVAPPALTDWAGSGSPKRHPLWGNWKENSAFPTNKFAMHHLGTPQGCVHRSRLLCKAPGHAPRQPGLPYCSPLHQMLTGPALSRSVFSVVSSGPGEQRRMGPHCSSAHYCVQLMAAWRPKADGNRRNWLCGDGSEEDSACKASVSSVPACQQRGSVHVGSFSAAGIGFSKLLFKAARGRRSKPSRSLG